MRSRYSFPYQRALHERMMRTTLKPVVIIGLCVLLALPLFLTAILYTQGTRQCRAFARDFASELSLCAMQMPLLEEENAQLLRQFLTNGQQRVAVYELLYAFRNHYAAGAYFELTTRNGEQSAINLPVHSDYTIRGDALLWKKLQESNDLVEQVQVSVSSAAHSPVVILSMPIAEKGKVLGALSMLWLPSRLDELTAHYRNTTLLTTYTGRIIYQNGALQSFVSKRFEAQRLFGPLIQFSGALYLVSSAPVDGSSITVHVLTGFDFIGPVLLFSLLFIVALVAVMSLAIQRLSYQVATGPLLEPFDKLFTALKRYGEGDTLSRIAVNPDDDTAPYLTQFNDVLDEVELLLRKNRELAHVTSVSELKMLESQFQPHFMFNTLDMIKYTIKDDPDLAVQVVLTLANMLRYTLDVCLTEVSVREDLRYLRDYLNMQALRLGEWFTYEVNCPDEVLDCTVPKLIMQPLIENSVKYGFTGEKPFLLSIVLEKTDCGMVITISDNGAGIEKTQLDSLNAALMNDEQPGRHVGLYNTNRRLVLTYGADAVLRIQSQLGKGTRVTMRLLRSGREEKP